MFFLVILCNHELSVQVKLAYNSADVMVFPGFSYSIKHAVLQVLNN